MLYGTHYLVILVFAISILIVSNKKDVEIEAFIKEGRQSKKVFKVH